MRLGSGDAPPLLLIEPDHGLQALFTALLSEEGYGLVLATSFEEGFRLVEEQTFALVLADVWMGHASLDLEQAHALRAGVYPVPVAILSRVPLPPSAKPVAFAFVLPLPFNLDTCLSLIATTLNTPLNAQQEAQAQVVDHLLEAIEAGDWQALAALHTEDVICVPPEHSRGTSARWVQGQVAFRTWAERLFETYQLLRVSTTWLAATPRGLAVRYTMHWQERVGPVQRAGTLFLRFQGERICQVGVRITLPALAVRPDPPHDASSALTS
jgi:CheY-like chemotaxis protein